MRLPVEKIRAQFPPLVNGRRKRPFRYLDSACVTLRPQSVVDAICEYYRDFPGCHGRTVHRLGREVTRRYEEAHAAVGQMIGAAHPGDVIFVRNTTEGINAVCRGLGLKPHDTVYASDCEHNSNLLPWQVGARDGRFRFRIFRTRDDTTFDVEAFRRDFPPGCRLVTIHSTSNVTGTSFPLEQIVAESHGRGALVLVDAAQSMVTAPPDVRRLGVDFLTFSAHKMFGPSGMGALYVAPRHQAELVPWLVGGETITDTTYEDHTPADWPDRLEAGLQNYAGAVGLAAAVRFVQALDRCALREHLVDLNTRLTEALTAMPGVRVLGPADPALRPTIINAAIDGIDVHRLATLLDDAAGVMARSGRHCCHAWYHARGLPESLRFSFSAYTSHEEIDATIQALGDILRHFRSRRKGAFTTEAQTAPSRD